MNRKKLIVIALFIFLLLFAFGCADSQKEVNDERDEVGEEQHEYNPEVVDTLTEDFENIKW
jgi:outer membrane lipoprotein-sorting protein